MNKDDLLKAFADLSPEDQEAIRAALANGETAEEETAVAYSPMAMCKEKMEKMGGKCC